MCVSPVYGGLFAEGAEGVSTASCRANMGQYPANGLVRPRAQVLRHDVTITEIIDFPWIDSSKMSRPLCVRKSSRENRPILTQLVAVYVIRQASRHPGPWQVMA
jgi:hypothetical protein